MYVKEKEKKRKKIWNKSELRRRTALISIGITRIFVDHCNNVGLILTLSPIDLLKIVNENIIADPVHMVAQQQLQQLIILLTHMLPTPSIPIRTR